MHAVSVARRTTAVLAVSIAGIIAVASCSSSRSTKQQTKTTEKQSEQVSLFPSSDLNAPQATGSPVAGGSLTFGLESATATLIPGQIQQPADYTVADAVFDQIVGFDDKGAVAPTGLASGWKNTPDLKTWTFTLRPNITFTDGSKVDAAAVVTQFNALRALTGCGCAADVAHITDVAALSEYVVEFKLDQAGVAFPLLLAGNAGLLAAPASWASPASIAAMTSHPVGSGPFKLLSTGKLTFVRNPTYWRKSPSGQALPYLDKISFVSLSDPTSRLAALRARSVDIFQTADTTNLVLAKKDPTMVVQPITGSSSTVVLLNSNIAPFNDIRLRQAFNYAINREALNKAYYQDSRVPAYGPLDPSNPFYDPSGQLPGYNPTEAKKLVAALKAEGKPTTFSSICISTTEATSVFNILKKQEQAVGLDVTLRTVDQAALVGTLSALKPDSFEASCFRNGQVADPDALYTSFYRTGGQNFSQTSDLALDEALRDGRKTTDPQQRKAAYDRVQQLIAKDVTVVPLLFDLYGNVHSKSVSGLSRPRPNALGSIDPGSLYLLKG